MSEIPATAAPGSWTEPTRAYLFKLVLDGTSNAAHFTAVDGLGVEVEPIEYREAGAHQVVRQLPGRVRNNRVTLSYGLTTDQDMWRWMLSATSGKVVRREVSIAMLDSTGSDVVLLWNLTSAWPCASLLQPLDALSNAAAIARLTLVHEGLTLDAAPTT